MKNLQNNFTTPEQSRRLLELGVPADSADCFWFDEKEIFFLQDKLYSDEAKDGELVRAIDYTPCWSVGRLIEIAKICSKSRYALRGLFLFLEECNADECMSQVMDYFEICNYQFDFLKLEE